MHVHCLTLLANGDLLLIGMLSIFLVPVGLAAVLSLWALRPWLRAMSRGVPLPLFDVIGMRLRRLDTDVIIETLETAAENGVDVSPVDIQHAMLAKVDVSHVMAELIAARQQGRSESFAALANRAASATNPL